MRESLVAALALSLVLVTVPSVGAQEPLEPTADVSEDFEGIAAGCIDGKQGWSSFGATGCGSSGCDNPPGYDHAVTDNDANDAYDFPGLGSKSLRISNAVVTGCYGDQTFSAEVAEAAGEPGATGGSEASGPQHNVFEASFTFASADPGSFQENLKVQISPDRGDGAQMGHLQIRDTPAGLAVLYFSLRGVPTDDAPSTGECVFVPTGRVVAAGLVRDVTHTLRIQMVFNDGPANDVVNVWVDGAPTTIGAGSWEDYFRHCQQNNCPDACTVDELMFRTGASGSGPKKGADDYPALRDEGLLFDDLEISTYDLTI